jgi:SAM-dependent methyltransferase
LIRSPKNAEDPFEQHVEQYEQWFADHPFAYVSELHAVRALLPSGTGVEIGVGTGRFAAPLGIRKGIEPAPAMAALAEKKGIEVIHGVAEKLPFKDREFDFALMVTTVCFLNDLDLAFAEVHRVLRDGGAFIVGFVDRESPLGREYVKRKDKSVFYKDATFYSVEEIVQRLGQAGFAAFEFRQTLFKPLEELEEVEPVKEGHGQGSFVVVRGIKK